MCERLSDIKAETVAQWFLCTFYQQHYLPRAIVSDQGAQFVESLWARLCQMLNIVRRLSTMYHSETDDSIKRMNKTLETYLQTFVDHAQDDWYDMLPSAEIAINNRDVTSTGVSPFFLQHDYHIDPLDLHADLSDNMTRDSPIQQADKIIRKLKDTREWAEAAMATAQQVMKKITNHHRQQAPTFKIGDKVWLNLENIRTDRPAKKLDAKHAKFTVVGVVGSHSYRLDTPPGIHNVFHSKLLRLASYDPLASQVQDDTQPQPRLIQQEDEYEVEDILDEKTVRRKRQYLVKWTGYAHPTWEPVSAMQDVSALDRWEAQRGRRTNRGGEGDDVAGGTRWGC